MSGTVKIYGTFGASPGSDVDSLGHTHFTQEDDSDSISSNSPVGRPSGLTNTSYSYERFLFFKVTVAPDNQFTNFKVWSGTTSSPVPGVEFKVGTTNSYQTPVITKSAIATYLLHSAYPSFAVSLGVTGTLVNINDESSYFVMQANVNSAAAIGDIDSTRTIIHISYDES